MPEPTYFRPSHFLDKSFPNLLLLSQSLLVLHIYEQPVSELPESRLVVNLAKAWTPRHRRKSGATRLSCKSDTVSYVVTNMCIETCGMHCCNAPRAQSHSVLAKKPCLQECFAQKVYESMCTLSTHLCANLGHLHARACCIRLHAKMLVVWSCLSDPKKPWASEAEERLRSGGAPPKRRSASEAEAVTAHAPRCRGPGSEASGPGNGAHQAAGVVGAADGVAEEARAAVDTHQRPLAHVRQAALVSLTARS